MRHKVTAHFLCRFGGFSWPLLVLTVTPSTRSPIGRTVLKVGGLGLFVCVWVCHEAESHGHIIYQELHWPYCAQGERWGMRLGVGGWMFVSVCACGCERVCTRLLCSGPGWVLPPPNCFALVMVNTCQEPIQLRISVMHWSWSIPAMSQSSSAAPSAD